LKMAGRLEGLKKVVRGMANALRNFIVS